MGDILKRFKEIENSGQPRTLARVAYKTWVDYTPRDTGNARRRTKLKNTEIHADYAYATRLDNGWSQQFQGQGMSKPTIKALQDYIKNNLKQR